MIFKISTVVSCRVVSRHLISCKGGDKWFFFLFLANLSCHHRSLSFSLAKFFPAASNCCDDSSVLPWLEILSTVFSSRLLSPHARILASPLLSSFAFPPTSFGSSAPRPVTTVATSVWPDLPPLRGPTTPPSRKPHCPPPSLRDIFASRSRLRVGGWEPGSRPLPWRWRKREQDGDRFSARREEDAQSSVLDREGGVGSKLGSKEGGL